MIEFLKGNKSVREKTRTMTLSYGDVIGASEIAAKLISKRKKVDADTEE